MPVMACSRSSTVTTLCEPDADRGDLAGEVLGVGLDARVDLAVAVGLDAVALGLAVLREQDQRRGVGGLHREQRGSAG